MRIGLIGGAGFIGLAATRAIVAAGHEAVVIDSGRRLQRSARDLADVRTVAVEPLDLAGLRAALEGMDAAVLLAWPSIPATSMQSIPDDAAKTVAMALHAAEAASRAGAQRLVFISSGGAVYGPTRASPLDEEHPTHPISAYGAGKLAVEKYLPLFPGPMTGVSLRLSNPFGPYQLRGTPIGVIAGFARAMAGGEAVRIWGDGSVIRDFLDVEDAADAILAAADPARTPAGVFNVSSGVGRSLNEVLEALVEVSGVEPVVERTPGRPFDVPAVVLSHARLTEACGWRPTRPFRAALAGMWAAAREGAAG